MLHHPIRCTYRGFRRRTCMRPRCELLWGEDSVSLVQVQWWTGPAHTQRWEICDRGFRARMCTSSGFRRGMQMDHIDEIPVYARIRRALYTCRRCQLACYQCICGQSLDSTSVSVEQDRHTVVVFSYESLCPCAVYQCIRGPKTKIPVYRWIDSSVVSSLVDNVAVYQCICGFHQCICGRDQNANR